MTTGSRAAEGFDGISGGNSELFFNSIVDGHDILNGQGNDTDYDGENGDDIMVDGPGIQRNNGMDGFDWTIFKGDTSPVDADLGIRPFETRQALILRDRFDWVEGLSGWNGDDILTGASKLLIGEAFTDALTQAGVDRIHGMRSFLNSGPAPAIQMPSYSNPTSMRLAKSSSAVTAATPFAAISATTSSTAMPGLTSAFRCTQPRMRRDRPVPRLRHLTA